ncbi:MAG: hypothetical protein KJ579_08415, partial [Verrucomicrobia bacterium]|nr:hypothetical protein [Verrucomicrobiota bacterium]
MNSTRRDLLKSAAAVATLCGLGAATGSTAADRKSGLKIGVATLGFGDFTNADLAKELAATGIRVV